MTWISVKDRRPENGLQVLAYGPGATIRLLMSIDGYLDYATHWQPLPEPPMREDPRWTVVWNEERQLFVRRFFDGRYEDFSEPQHQYAEC